jgi:hypothetical protein
MEVPVNKCLNVCDECICDSVFHTEYAGGCGKKYQKKKECFYANLKTLEFEEGFRVSVSFHSETFATKIIHVLCYEHFNIQ